MSEPPKQRFVAYRQAADIVAVQFSGGPLDGASARTDERPTPGAFIHRVGGRNYMYVYSQTEPQLFVARYISQIAKEDESPLEAWSTTPTPAERQASGRVVTLVLVACVIALCGWLWRYCQG